MAATIWFSLAALAKETAILAPIALAGWELIWLAFAGKQSSYAKVSGIRVWGSRSRDCAHSFTASSAAHRLVRLSLCSHRICFRQSGILPLQRRLHAKPVAFSAGSRAAALAGVRIHASVAADLGNAAGDACFRRVQDGGVERRRIAIPVQISLLRRHCGVCHRNGVDWRSSAGSLHVDCGAAGDHSGSLNSAPASSLLDDSNCSRREEYSCWPGSGIRPTDSRRKTIWRIAITSSCIRRRTSSRGALSDGAVSDGLAGLG